jgi:hypothetical protein
MAKKNITFRIDEKLIEKFNELRGTTSQNAFLEQLVTSTSTSTSNDSQVQVQTNIDSQVQVQLQAQTEALEKLQAQVQLLVNQQVQVQVQVTEPIIKSEKETVKTWNGIELKSNDRIITDEHGVEMLVTDEIPEWQKKPLTPQDFYGKVPEPYTPGEYDHDPQRYLDEMDKEEGRSNQKPKPKKVEEEKPFNPFL